MDEYNFKVQGEIIIIYMFINILVFFIVNTKRADKERVKESWCSLTVKKTVSISGHIYHNGSVKRLNQISVQGGNFKKDQKRPKEVKVLLGDETNELGTRSLDLKCETVVVVFSEGC